MDYFIVKTSSKLNNPLTVSTAQNDFVIQEDCMMLRAEITKDTAIPDFWCANKMFQYYFFVSIPLYELLCDYVPDLEGIITTVADLESQEAEAFYQIEVPKAEYEEISGLERPEKIILREDAMPNPYLFRVVKDKKEYVLVSLHLAEHLLRTIVYGVELEPVEIEVQKENEAC